MSEIRLKSKLLRCIFNDVSLMFLLMFATENNKNSILKIMQTLESSFKCCIFSVRTVINSNCNKFAFPLAN